MKLRSATEFVRAADAAAPQIQPPEPATAPPAPPPAELKVVAPPTAVKAPKAAKAPTAPAPGPMPWDACHPKVIKHFGLRMSEVLHAKLLWVQEHSVNETMHSLALGAVEADIDRRIAELLKAGKGG